MTDVEQRIRAYVADVVSGLSPERITSISRFGSGRRHAVYRVSWVARDAVRGDVVVRIATSKEARERAWAEREAAVLRALDGVGAPRLLDFRWESRWFDGPIMCLQLVVGEQRPAAAVAPADVERLGALLGRLHVVPVDRLRPWFAVPADLGGYFDDRLRGIGRMLPSAGEPVPPQLRDRLQRAWRAVRALSERARGSAGFAAGAHSALLHGDAGPANIVWGPAPVLIDWEYARIGDPADDIAHYFGENDPDDTQRKAFWRGYAGGSPARVSLDPLADRVGWWEPVTLLGSALWWIGEWLRTGRADTGGDGRGRQPAEADRRLEQAVRRLDRLERRLAG